MPIVQQSRHDRISTLEATAALLKVLRGMPWRVPCGALLTATPEASEEGARGDCDGRQEVDPSSDVAARLVDILRDVVVAQLQASRRPAAGAWRGQDARAADLTLLGRRWPSGWALRAGDRQGVGLSGRIGRPRAPSCESLCAFQRPQRRRELARAGHGVQAAFRTETGWCARPSSCAAAPSGVGTLQATRGHTASCRAYATDRAGSDTQRLPRPGRGECGSTGAWDGFQRRRLLRREALEHSKRQKRTERESTSSSKLGADYNKKRARGRARTARRRSSSKRHATHAGPRTSSTARRAEAPPLQPWRRCSTMTSWTRTCST